MSTISVQISEARHVLFEEQRGRLLLLVAIGWLCLWGTTLVLPALLPWIVVEFGINMATGGLAITSVSFFYAISQFPAGLLADRIKQHHILIGSMAIAVVSLVLFVSTPTFLIFLVACVLFGIGTGTYGPSRDLLMSLTFPDNDGMAYGIIYAAGSLGASVLPLLATQIAVAYGWRISLIIILPLLAFVVMGLLKIGQPTEQTTGSNSQHSIGHVVRRIWESLQQPSVSLATVAFTITLFVFQGLAGFLPTYLVVEKDISPGIAGAIFGLFFASTAGIQPIAGYFADRYGSRSTLVALSTLSAVILAALPLVDDLMVLIFLVAILGFRGGIGPVNSTYLVSVLPDDVRGSGYGLVRTIYFGLSSGGAFFVGSLADMDLFDEAFFILAFLSIIATVMYIALE